MSGIGVSLWNPENPLGRIIPEAQAFFDRMTVQPNEQRKSVYNRLFTRLRDEGLLTDLDALWITAAHTAEAAGLNLISPSYTLAPINSPTFTTDLGYAGDGATSALDTGCTPNALVRYQPMNASLGIYINTDPGASGSMIEIGSANGTDPAGSAFIRSNQGSNFSGYRSNSGNTGTYPVVGNALGSHIISRTSNTLTTPYRNGAPMTTTAFTVSVTPNRSLYLCALNISTGPTAGSNRRIAAAHVGAGLSDTKAAALYSAISEYLNAIGAQ